MAPNSKNDISVFVSHATTDRVFVETALLPALHRAGIQCWYSPRAIETATDWEKSIRKGLQDTSWFLVVVSRRSIASEWVRAEVLWAVTNRKTRIIPVLIDDSNPADLYLLLGNIQLIDFRSSRETATKQLLAIWADSIESSDWGFLHKNKEKNAALERKSNEPPIVPGLQAKGGGKRPSDPVGSIKLDVKEKHENRPKAEGSRDNDFVGFVQLTRAFSVKPDQRTAAAMPPQVKPVSKHAPQQPPLLIARYQGHVYVRIGKYPHSFPPVCAVTGRPDADFVDLMFYGEEDDSLVLDVFIGLVGLAMPIVWLIWLVYQLSSRRKRWNKFFWINLPISKELVNQRKQQMWLPVKVAIGLLAFLAAILVCAALSHPSDIVMFWIVSLCALLASGVGGCLVRWTYLATSNVGSIQIEALGPKAVCITGIHPRLLNCLPEVGWFIPYEKIRNDEP